MDELNQAREDVQRELDQGAKALRKMIRQSIKRADEYCAAGNAQASADAWEMAARLCHAMAHGRSLNIGGVQPAFGGGGK